MNTGIRLYQKLGIRLLNKAIMATIGRLVLKINPREEMPSYYVGHPYSKESLSLTLKWLYFNEIMHFILLIICGLIGWFFLRKGYTAGVVILALTMMFNIALMMMQRMNRKRIRNTINCLEKRISRTLPG